MDGEAMTIILSATGMGDASIATDGAFGGDLMALLIFDWARIAKRNIAFFHSPGSSPTVLDSHHGTGLPIASKTP